MDKRRTISESAFVRDGFVVLDHFIEEIELPDLQRSVDALVGAAPESACCRPNNTLLPLRWNDGLVESLLASETRVNLLTEAIEAADLRWISGYVSIKDPESPPLWWHQDWWCWDHATSFRRAAPQIAVLCYLQATDQLNGGLRVLPGSHHRSSDIHASLPEPHGHAMCDVKPDHQAMIDQPGQISLRLKAGDAVAIDYRLLHGTHANGTGSRRDCILLSFAPAWRNLPSDIQGHLIDHLAQPAVGESVPMVHWQRSLFPTFEGTRRSLSVNRMPPRNFQIGEGMDPMLPATRQ